MDEKLSQLLDELFQLDDTETEKQRAIWQRISTECGANFTEEEIEQLVN